MIIIFKDELLLYDLIQKAKRETIEVVFGVENNIDKINKSKAEHKKIGVVFSLENLKYAIENFDFKLIIFDI